MKKLVSLSLIIATYAVGNPESKKPATLQQCLNKIELRKVSEAAFQAHLAGDPLSHKNYLSYEEKVVKEVAKDPLLAKELASDCPNAFNPQNYTNPAAWNHLVQCQALIMALHANGIKT